MSSTPAAGHQCWHSCAVVLDSSVPCSAQVSGSFNISNWHSTHKETEAVAVVGVSRGSLRTQEVVALLLGAEKSRGGVKIPEVVRSES